MPKGRPARTARDALYSGVALRDQRAALLESFNRRTKRQRRNDLRRAEEPNDNHTLAAGIHKIGDGRPLAELQTVTAQPTTTTLIK
jgi:hypothetical protein